jgi:hypothetical protein
MLLTGHHPSGPSTSQACSCAGQSCLGQAAHTAGQAGHQEMHGQGKQGTKTSSMQGSRCKMGMVVAICDTG